VPVASKLISHRTRYRQRVRGEVIAVDFRRRRRIVTPSARGGTERL
jgi:hypothetical protein